MAEQTFSNLLGGLAESFSPQIAQRNLNARRLDLEEQRMSQAGEKDNYNKLLKQFEIYQTMDEKLAEGISDRTTPAEQGEAARAALRGPMEALASQLGLQLPGATSVSPEPEDPKTDLGKYFALSDRLQRQMDEEADPTRLQVLQDRQKQAIEAANAAGGGKQKLAVHEFGGSKYVIDMNSGDIVKRLGRSKAAGTSKPDTRTLRITDEDGKTTLKQLDVSTPSGLQAFRDAIDNGAIETTRPSSNNKSRRISVGSDGRMIFEEGIGVDRAVGERNRLANPLNAMEGALLQLFEIDQRLKPEHVGMQGAIQEQFLNRFVAPFAELAGIPTGDLVDTDFVQSRRLMGLVGERLQRIVQDNPDRFSNQDVDRISKILIKPDPRITYKEYKDTLSTVIQFFQDKRLMTSHQLGRRTVLDMTPNEILDAVQSGQMTEALAARVINARFTQADLDAAEAERAEQLPPQTTLEQPQRPE